jgi:hypothetical protein
MFALCLTTFDCGVDKNRATLCLVSPLFLKTFLSTISHPCTEYHLENLWEDKIKMGLQEIGWEVCTGLIWLQTGTDGRVAVSYEHVINLQIP